MERRHAEEQKRSEYERGEEVGAAGVAVREHDGAEEANDDASKKRKLNR